MDLNDSFTENLLQRSTTRKEYLNAKMKESSSTVGKKRTALSDRNFLEESPKRQCLNPSDAEKENAFNQETNQEIFVPFKALSNVRGLAALKKQETKDTCVNLQTIFEEENHVPEQENKKALSSTKSLDILKEESVQNVNVHETIQRKKEFFEKEKGSNIGFEPVIKTEPAVLPLAARKAFFEKATAVHNDKPSEQAFQPKLSIAQRTALFENAVKQSHEVKPQAKSALPKRFVSSAPLKSSDVHKQETTASKDNSSESSQYSDKIVETAELMDITNEDIPSSLSPKECTATTNIVSSPEKSVSDDVFVLPNQTNSQTNQIVNSVPDIMQEEFEDVDKNTLNILTAQEQVSESEDFNIHNNKSSTDKYSHSSLSSSDDHVSEVEVANTKEKLIETTSTDTIQNFHQTTTLPDSISSSIDSPKRSSVVSTTSSQQEEADKKILSCLVSRWEKRSSSSFGSSNSEEEPSIRQSEKSSTNTYESDGDRADCESNLESEYNDTESVSGSKAGDLAKHPSLGDFKDEAPEQEVFNPASFKAEAGLMQFDVETDSYIATDDENASCNGKKVWQKRVEYPNQPDNWSLTSAISEASLFYDSASLSQTYSSSESLATNQVKELAEQEKESSKTSGRSSPLVHTVSFFRKHRLASKSSPTTATKRPHDHTEEGSSAQRIQQQIMLLKEEIMKQQTVIGQTSQALNLCHSTPQFSGSSEQIEAERLLLIATQKRLAFEKEIGRLKSLDHQNELVSDRSGTLVIAGLNLPLKTDFIAMQLKGETSTVHHFLCVIHHGAQVIVTQMASTTDKLTDGALCFPNHIRLQNLPPDFSILFEVYTLETSKENLSHEKKYQIKREHSKLRLNSRSKKSESKLLLPAINSPGGPNAVSSPSFSLIGYTRFTVQNCIKKCFCLDKIPYTSPLEGILKVKLQLHAAQKTSEKGFLTRFEDVGGYGLWNRLWCSLDSHKLSYWRYPDEEQSKDALGVIDLRQCVTKKVEPVSRDVCARPNTVLLLMQRKREEGDRDSLVSESVGAVTTTRHLLSADTKEERIVWCNKLNEALANVRKWDAQALRPLED
ncbi:hypothetical protein JTE90_007176 [Oedothorax gibbosus]|uniref:PH domain-containing protein n=1 Tax=Oedothorax gibbosus TaxID=931172 RepID=A0AAV6UYH3_9ARAC|nr:hypothetical protein JTE90_007176 [Oedothorax gibbosus]